MHVIGCIETKSIRNKEIKGDRDVSISYFLVFVHPCYKYLTSLDIRRHYRLLSKQVIYPHHSMVAPAPAPLILRHENVDPGFSIVL